MQPGLSDVSRGYRGEREMFHKKGAATVAGKLRELVSLKGGAYATAA